MVNLTAAPIVRQPMHIIGAPGKTDFVKIYIASELNKQEYRTTLRHEQAHVWSAHNRRRPKEVNYKLWVVACEMEIARTIYDDLDVANIEAPRSRLSGGYLKGSIKNLPDDIVLAEDIYIWLLNNQESKEFPDLQCCGCSFDSSSEADPLEASIDIPSVVQEAKDKLDSEEKKQLSQEAAHSNYLSIKNRPPSLTAEVDAILRVRIEREKSYRRPSRRSNNDNVLLSGTISTPRPPLVEIFVDRSGSFTPEKTEKAENQLKLLLSRYGSTIRADVWFFGSGKLTSYDHKEGGDTPYGLIASHIAESSPKLAIIITDDDPVSSDVCIVDKRTRVLCIPIGCNKTKLSSSMGGIDVITR